MEVDQRTISEPNRSATSDPALTTTLAMKEQSIMAENTVPTQTKPHKCARGKHGNHRRGRRVEYVRLECSWCHRYYEKSPGFMRMHPDTKHCCLRRHPLPVLQRRGTPRRNG
jgi:hypothetical protein